MGPRQSGSRSLRKLCIYFHYPGIPWIITEPRETQSLGSLTLPGITLVCSLYIYSILFIPSPYTWLHCGVPRPASSLTLQAQSGPCSVPSLPACVSGPQVHFLRKKSSWHCWSGAPVDHDSQGQGTRPGEGRRGRSQG